MLLDVSKGFSTDSKSIWEKIEALLPSFALFKAGRESSDGDAEAKNPLQQAVKEAQAALQGQISALEQQIEARVLDVADRPPDKLREIAPELASELIPRFKEKPNRPHAFAYPGEGDAPHQWMLHEVTHQLLAEASGLSPQRWMNEGMACNFGASRLSGGVLHVGAPDPASYPVWWLGELRFDGAGRPSLYYLAWWSLVHFLMERDGQAHRRQALLLLHRRGDPAAFQQLIGSYAEFEPRWHQHLRALARTQGQREMP